MLVRKSLKKKEGERKRMWERVSKKKKKKKKIFLPLIFSSFIKKKLIIYVHFFFYHKLKKKKKNLLARNPFPLDKKKRETDRLLCFSSYFHRLSDAMKTSRRFSGTR